VPRFRPMFSCPAKRPAVALGLFALTLLAAPAAAAPIFSQASLTPDAISPNGDDVQEFTVVSYTIAVDSADVRVVLAVSGGAPLDTLQTFTRQGAGVHTLVGDGTGRSGAVPDGAYDIKVVGVGALGEGQETAALPLLIDRVAPGIVSWDLVTPAGPGLRDGDLVTLQGCFAEDPDSVAVDLSALDSGFTPGAVTRTPLPSMCLRFTYTITPGNTVPDADGLPAVLKAFDRAGNVSTSVLPLCISNQPPSVVDVAFLNATPFLQNGDEIQTQIEFQAPDGITPGADFSNLDSNFDPGAVVVTPLGGSRYEIRYRISDTNVRPDGDYALHLFGRDAGCGVAADSSLSVTLDNAGVNVTLLNNVTVNRPAFSPSGNGVHTVNIRFTVLEDSVNVVVLTPNALLKNPAATEFILIQNFRIYNKGTYTVTWDGSGIGIPPERLDDQVLSVAVRGVSSDQDRTRQLETSLEVDNIPPILTDFPDPNSLEFKNGKLVVLPVSYDRPGYAIAADFSAVDSGFNSGNVVVTDDGGGDYRIFYTLRPTNTRLDGVDYSVLLTAVDLAGNVRDSVDVVQACLNNTPPRFVPPAVLLESQGPFSNGSRIVLQTTWQSEAQQPDSDLVVTADFSAIDENFDPGGRPATVIWREKGVFEISYIISPGNSITTGSQLPIYVTASDRSDEGCGSTTVDALRIDLDNEAAPQPTLVASAVTVRGDVVTLSGDAPEAVEVQILRNGAAVDTFAVGADSRYSGQAVLAPGLNKFAAKSIDAAGNVSQVSRTVDVFSVQGTTVTIPPRFAPGDEIFVAVLDPSQVLVRLFNLEGVEIQRLSSASAAVHHIVWDGKDRIGALASSGPCLAVVEIQSPSGSVRQRIKKAFIFTRRGANDGN